MASWHGRSYPVGTKVRHRNGYVFVKVENDDSGAKMMAESRRIWELTHGPLEEGDRVFHINGNREDNSVKNLAMVHFNQTKFKFYKSSEILYMPSTKVAVLLPTMRTLDKKTGKVLVNS